ncbi:MAG: hypothetical protein AYK22_04755 [Thermoplasmatales archaeon SG8-52-3]|nr:MAG: hypothetical protein AYK22_04755 [Thermoplasmatales archaeon SG8-52-3]
MSRLNWFLTIVTIVLFVGFSVIPSSGVILVNKPLSINKSGTILYVGGVEPGNYSTIQSAIDNASPGDTVFVYDDSSPYYENIRVNKAINLIGENRNTTIINRINNKSYTICIYGADNTFISGFTIINGYEGIWIASNNTTIINNKILFNKYGIFIDNYNEYRDNIISDNIIVHNDYMGIFDGCRDSNNIVKWNVIGGNGREYRNYYHKGGGVFKHRCGGIFHHNDFDLNWGGNAYTDFSRWGIWDDDSEGNYWDDWPGYPNYYIIRGTEVNQYDYYPRATPYFNHTIVCVKSSYQACPGESIHFSAYATNKPSSSLSWFWEFGDGKTSTEISPSNAYDKSGIYQVNVTVTDSRGVSDTDRCTAYIGIPPDKPTIKGPTKSRPGRSCEFSIVTTDPDSDYISYDILWEDGTGDYVKEVPSGEEVKVYHTWYYPSNFTIGVYAIDETHRESDWVFFTIEISRARVSYSSLFLRFLDVIPVIERLLNLLY